MEKGCVISMYLHVHIRYIQTLLVHGNVYFKAGMAKLSIRRHLETENMNRGFGMLEAGLSLRHVAGVFWLSQSDVERMWERFRTH